MKSRQLAAVLALILAVGLFWIIAPKAEAAEHTHNGKTFSAWSDSTSLPTTAGNYYLTVDVTLAYEEWHLTKNVNLCLNGHTIRQTKSGEGVVDLNPGATLSIYDCKTSGKITGGTGSVGAVWVCGTFNLYGGRITGNKTTTSAGGGVSVNAGAVFTMYGGQIDDNAAFGKGGGVGVFSNGIFTMQGGEITGNHAVPENPLLLGGGVFVETGGTVNLRNGVISDNEAKNGGGIYSKGDVNLQGENVEIRGNGASTDGGGLYLEAGTLTFNGGAVMDNAASGKGGGVYVGENAELTFFGGSVSANSATDGGGLYVLGTTQLRGSSARIENNTAAGNGGGVCAPGTSKGFTVFDGVISGNEGVRGGGIYSVSTLMLQNAVISGNAASTAGGGVYVASGSTSRIQVKGAVNVAGNTHGSDPSDLYLRPGKLVEFTGSVDLDNAHIGFDLETKPTDSDGVVFTKNFMNADVDTYREFFGIDDPDGKYGVMLTTVNGSYELMAVTLPKITRNPTAITAVYGNPAAFSAKATGYGITYQWEYSKDGGDTWITWNGKTSSQVTVNAKNNDGWYYRVCVTSPLGYDWYLWSEPARLTVRPILPSITTQPKNASVVSGKTATFKVTAEGGSLTYQWQYKTAGSTAWKTWTGKTAASVTVTAGTGNNGCSYRVTVKNGAGSVTSAEVTLILLAAPKITTQPKNQTVAQGKSVTFKVIASGTGLTYQWEYKPAGSTTWKTWTGKTSASVTVTAGTGNNGCSYRVVVKNAAGSVTSSAAKLTAVTKPVITTQPKSQTVTSGKSVTFKVVASGGGLSYQWEYKPAGSTAWKTWTGKTSASVTVTAGSGNNGCSYRCVVKNAAGSVTSSAAKLTVTG